MVFKTIQNPFRILCVLLFLLAIWVTCTQKAPLDPTQSLRDEVSMLLDLTVTASKIKIGGFQSAIQVRLVDEKGGALARRTIKFETTLGTLSAAEKITDTDGWVNNILKSGNTAGTATITVNYERLVQKSITVQFITSADTSETQMDLMLDKSELLANGMDRAQLLVSLVPGIGQYIVGNTVTFTTTAGTIPTAATIDKDNLAGAFLVSPLSHTDINAIVTASFRDILKITSVMFKGVQFSAEANPTVILADGKSASIIRAHVKETTTQMGIAGAEIRFGASIGTISGLKITDDRGVAEAQLTGTRSGTSVVIVWYGKTFLDTVTVQLQESLPVYLDVSATPSVLPSDGFSQSVIKATVTDFSRNPVPDGTNVLYDIIDGSGSIIRQKSTAGGIAESIFTASTKPDTVKIVVRVGSLSDTVTVYCKVGEAENVLVSSDLTRLPADGISVANIQARVLDSQGNAVQGVTVRFKASIGDITPSAPTNAQGIAGARYSSGAIGNATIEASVQKGNGILVTGTIQIQLLPGKPDRIQLDFNPRDMGVKETGQNQTVEVIATVKDTKGNSAEDGTPVKFSIFAGPGGGESLSTNMPVPTVGGTAKVSFSSGTRSGDVRIQAEVVNTGGNPLNPPVKAVSTRLIIHAGPPYIENVADIWSTHLTIVARRLNIWVGEDTTTLSMVVGDKYNNPVEPGTAVYLTTSGGVVTTKSYTADNGIVNDTLIAANPFPTINRFYNYIGLQDPNLGTIIPGPIPDFEKSQVLNSQGNYGENDGVARVVAYSEGIDINGKKARAWDWLWVIFSTPIMEFSDNSAEVISQTGSQIPYLSAPKQIQIRIWDTNGNPICSGSKVFAQVVPPTIQMGISWTQWDTGNDAGITYYPLMVSNAIDPQTPKPGWAQVKLTVESKNGKATIFTQPFYVSYP